MVFQIFLTRSAQKSLLKIKNPVTRELIAEVINSLADNPQQKGKPLRGALSGYRSIRAARQRYRIVYKVDQDKVIVYVIAIGQRKGKDRGDVYRILERLIKRGDDLEKK